MGLFDSSNQSMFESEAQSEQQQKQHSVMDSILFKALGVIFAIPAVIVGLINFWGLFAKGRLRPSVIACIDSFILLISMIAWHIINPISKLTQGFSGFTSLYLLTCIISGIIFSYLLILFKSHQLVTTPSLLSMNGWMNHFHYRKTPLEIFMTKYIKKELADGKCYSPEASPLGILEEPELTNADQIDEDRDSLRPNKPRVIYRDYKEALKHCIITGATGSGKTISMLSMMYNDIRNGIPLCVIDFKKSADVLYFLSKWAKENGREFYYFANGDDMDGSEKYGIEKSTYDPLSIGSQTAKSDFILSLRQWDTSSDVYRSRTESLLNALFFALITVDKKDVPKIPWNEGGLAQILAAMETENIYLLIKALLKKDKKGELSRTDRKRILTLQNIYSVLLNKTPEGKGLREQLDGIKLICNKLIMSSYGNWLSKDNTKHTKHIDLMKIATDPNGPVVLFAFSPMEEPEFAKAIGSIIMSDLKRVANTKIGMDDSNYFGVYIDEFQTIAPETISDLLEKARSAGVFVTIASQSLEKIEAASANNGEATLNSILDTCGNYLFHYGAKQDSAERIAKIVGKTKHIVRHTTVKTNSGVFHQNLFNSRHGISNSELTDDYILSPSKLQNLSAPNSKNGFKSEAYFINGINDENASQSALSAKKIQVIAQHDLIAGVPENFRSFIANDTQKTQRKYSGDFFDESTLPHVTVKNEMPKSENVGQNNELNSVPHIGGIPIKKIEKTIQKESDTNDSKSEEVIHDITPQEDVTKPKKVVTTFDRMKAQNNKPKKQVTKRPEPTKQIKNDESKKFSLPKL